ncbi:MAG: spore germination protein [Clostridiaceae bacterium]|nr:spore germination protein [Clostridiaceae bacterium]
MRYYQRLIRQIKQQTRKKEEKEHQEQEEPPRRLCSDLKENTDALKGIFGESSDLVIREFVFGKEGELQAVLMFIDGMVNLSLINDNIVKPLMYDSRMVSPGKHLGVQSMKELRDRLLSAGDIKAIYTISEAAEGCINGDAILLVDGFDEAVEISAKGWDKRAVSEPNTETVVRGPREGFTENLRTNTAMIRRKIKNPALKICSVTVGKRTRTPVNILYIEGITNPKLVKEVERRIGNIDTDEVLAVGYIEQFIEDSPYSAFQTMWYSEKPDAIAGKLLEGRVAIIMDGTPFVLSIPMLFMENFQTSEDYAIRSYYATVLRLLRLTAFFISMFAPALYVALVTFHQELIPTALLFTMAAASEGVPFPAVVETGLMLLSFEIIKEAGVRMPRPVGQAISIVGALVMGQSAVQAGIVGAPVVIVIAITAVSSFVTPIAADAVFLLRWMLLILASAMGLFGVTMGALALLVHLVSLRSFGTHYFAPLAPFQPDDIKDTVIRAPLWTMRTRPRALHPQDLKRQNFNIPFDPTAGKEKPPGGKS